MHTKDSLIAQLHTLPLDPYGTLMVHISCKAIGAVDGRGDGVLDALCEYMREGLLVMPAHTWEHVGEENPVMDVLYTTSCIGILPELFRERAGVARSLHPTHSVCALGKGVAEFVAGEEHIASPCGKGGAYYKLWERDAQIMLIGVNFNRNTYIHGIEEWDGAVGSISDNKTDMYVINQQGQRLHTPQRRHCSPLGSETFCKLEAPAIAQGILTFGRFGDATVRLMRAKPLREMVAGLLKEDAGYLLRY
ncbi:MAG: AAC(3) family N-acetyltransferase [Lachnospiraceae bacterium]|jgi:aminoglycoside 3-N-acetyltransferase|nr:AAC(3) family N-acetyltransferase [Lachnospiraceae bacterium]